MQTFLLQNQFQVKFLVLTKKSIAVARMSEVCQRLCLQRTFIRKSSKHTVVTDPSRTLPGTSATTRVPNGTTRTSVTTTGRGNCTRSKFKSYTIITVYDHWQNIFNAEILYVSNTIRCIKNSRPAVTTAIYLPFTTK